MFQYSRSYYCMKCFDEWVTDIQPLVHHKKFTVVCMVFRFLFYISIYTIHTYMCIYLSIGSVQFSLVTQSYLTPCNLMNHSTPGLPVHHQLLEFTQTHVHWVSDAIQPSHPLSSPSPALNASQHQSLFQWVNSSHEVAKVLEFQL